jgi:hypothetical protein
MLIKKISAWVNIFVIVIGLRANAATMVHATYGWSFSTATYTIINSQLAINCTAGTVGGSSPGPAVLLTLQMSAFALTPSSYFDMQMVVTNAPPPGIPPPVTAPVRAFYNFAGDHRTWTTATQVFCPASGVLEIQILMTNGSPGNWTFVSDINDNLLLTSSVIQGI